MRAVTHIKTNMAKTKITKIAAHEKKGGAHINKQQMFTGNISKQYEKCAKKKQFD